MVKVEISDESQIDELLSAEQYSEMIGEYLQTPRFRIKEFLVFLNL